MRSSSSSSFDSFDRGVDEDTHEKVTTPPSAKRGDAVAGDLEHAARLDARRDREQIGAVEGVQLDLRAERGLGDRQVQRRDKVRARPLETGVRPPRGDARRGPPTTRPAVRLRRRRRCATWRRRRHLPVCRR